MTRSPTRSRSRPASLCPRVKVWLETENRYAFGFGLSQILQAVEQAGAIKQAAADMGKSYRYVWGRIKQAERALGRRLVETRVGGAGTRRSFLTPEARQLSEDFLTFRSRVAAAVQEEFARAFRGGRDLP